jgi:probable O-glycosylation ligase (exosortase A-associated)
MRALILLGIILVCAAIALRRPCFGVLTFVWLGFFNPQSMTWGGAPFSLIMALSAFVGYFFSSEPKRFPLQAESVLLIVLWGVFGFTTMFAIYPDRALNDLIFVSKILAMVLLSICVITSDERLQSLVRVIALSLGYYAVTGFLFVIVSGGNSIVFGPQGSFLEANNMIGLALVMNLPLLAYLIEHEDKPWLRGICRLMLLCSFPTVIFTYSRGAWLGLAVVGVLLVLRSRYKIRIAAAGAFFALFLLPFAGELVPEHLERRYEDLENYQTETSAQMRFGSWAYCWRVAVAHPIFGGGFNHYSTATYERYAPEFLDKYGGKTRWRMTNCHSAWFTVISEHGFPGFILWVGLGTLSFFSLSSIRAQTAARLDMLWMYNLAGGLQIALVGFVVVGSFIDAAYFDMLYYMVAIAVIMKEILAYSPTAVSVPQAVTVTDKRVLLSARSSLQS